MKRKQHQTSRVLALANSPATSGLGTKRDVASQFQVSVRTVDQWMKEKRIPFVRISARCVRFHLPSVLKALERYTVETAA